MTAGRAPTAAVLAALLLLGACGGDDDKAPAERPATEQPEKKENRPGNPAVYERIEALTDCGALQKEFDIAMDTYDRRKEDHSLAYAKAAQARIEALKCP